jgi:D-arabinonate dehydratase
MVIGEQLRTIVVGRHVDDVADIEDTWSAMVGGLASRRGARGALLTCVAAVDMALWDLLGKARRLPVAALVGPPRDLVPTYANLAHLRDPAEAAATAARFVAEGHRALKLRGARAVGTPAEATRRVTAVREAVGPDVLVMVDVNGSWDVGTAVEQLGVWERAGLDVHWLEEPVPPDDIAGYVEVRRAAGRTLIAGGEQHSGRIEFDALLDAGAVDVLQPGAIVAGGITEWLRICRQARQRGVAVSPWDLQVVHVHLAAGCHDVRWVEYFHPDNSMLGFQHRLIRGASERLVAGDAELCLPAPVEPGLGLTIDEAAET